MALDEIIAICADYAGVTQDMKWGNNLCFSVGGKMFMILSLDDYPVSACFKVKEEEYEKYIECPGFCPAPYLARYRWVMVEDITILSMKEWEQVIDQSYHLVFQRLPLRRKKEIMACYYNQSHFLRLK